MWIFSKNIGFVSVVAKTNDGNLTVRSRVRGDLERLKDLIPDMGKIISNAGTDYPFRVVVSKDQFALAMAKMVYDIDYPNFKNMVYAVFGEVRERFYSHVWEIMYRLKNDKQYRL